MNILKRLLSIGKAESHSALDQLEDPIKMTEQGIRELKEDLDNALHALAEIKALVIRARNDIENYGAKANEYEEKAILLLKRVQKGDLSTEEGDRLASESLIKKDENLAHVVRTQADKEKYEANVATMEANIKRLKSQISKYENELRTLKARVTVSNATKNINKQLAQLDSSGTVSMLERMKEKVARDEALAESYGQIANESKSIDEEIDKALEGSSKLKAADDLAALKQKLGM
jgi:phage shock protein A